MKKLLLGIAMALVAGSSFADDYLSLTPEKFSLKPGETQDVELVLNVAAQLSYTALQVQIALPEGTRPAALNADEIALYESLGIPVEAKYAQVTMPSFPASISGNFQVSTNVFEKGQDIYKTDAQNNKVYERTTTKPELGIVLMSLSATPFPLGTQESLIKFRIEATDRCYTGEEGLDLTFATLNTKDMTGYNPEDRLGAALMTYSIDYTIGEDGYGTLCWPVALDFTPNGFDAGTGSLDGYFVKMNKVTTIPAATPVIIKGEPGTYSLTTTRAESFDDVSGNVLEGNPDAPLTVSNSNTFALAKLNEGIGFYRCESGVIIPQYKAYYNNSTSSVDAFLFEETTGINKVENNSGNAEVFTISGMKVDKANKKGVYIVNGKKVVVK